MDKQPSIEPDDLGDMEIHPEVKAMVDRLKLAQAERKLTGRLNQEEAYEYERQKAERLRQEKLEACGIYPRYANCTFEAIAAQGVPPKAKANYEEVYRYAQNIDENLKNGIGLILRGHVGTMKTSLAVAVLQSLIQAGRSGFFITMPSLTDTIFMAKERSSEEWITLENKIKTTPLLILDDLGGESSNEWLQGKLKGIFSERYNRFKSTIITTNLTSDEMIRRYPDLTIDRLRSTCHILTFADKSLRMPITGSESSAG